MKELLEPLAKVPGVMISMLISEDGVPVAVPGQALDKLTSDDLKSPFRDADVLAALAASWMDELARSVGQLSWNTPKRVVLAAANGSLLMIPTSGAVLVVVIERGLRADELWLPMAGAAARIARHLRSMGRGMDLDPIAKGNEQTNESDAAPDGPNAPLPAKKQAESGAATGGEPSDKRTPKRHSGN